LLAVSADEQTRTGNGDAPSLERLALTRKYHLLPAEVMMAELQGLIMFWQMGVKQDIEGMDAYIEEYADDQQRMWKWLESSEGGLIGPAARWAFEVRRCF
jgi:hypothetical protein